MKRTFLVIFLSMISAPSYATDCSSDMTMVQLFDRLISHTKTHIDKVKQISSEYEISKEERIRARMQIKDDILTAIDRLDQEDSLYRQMLSRGCISKDDLDVKIDSINKDRAYFKSEIY